MNYDIYETLSSAIKSGKPVCLATVVKADGSTPRSAGAKMVVFSDGTIAGTIGGSLLEKNIIDKALEVIKDGVPCVETISLKGSSNDSKGMICGGEMTVFLEPVTGLKNLLIFGAGHCGKALAATAISAGFAVHIFDDRAEYANRKNFPYAVSITVGEYDEISLIDPPGESYAAIMTQGHSADTQVLKNLIKKKYCYIGMMASKRKREQVFDKLLRDGVDKTLLYKVYSPIGIEINAETPEEIAISITAELIQKSKELQVKK